MKKKILITGGCGFIGSNASAYFIKKGFSVVVLDNLSRVGSNINLKWLKELHGDFIFENIDIKNYSDVFPVFEKYRPNFVLHLAGQTTVTDSIKNPRNDFENNALGTLNILESIRNFSSDSSLIYSSTNKVMGDLIDIPILEGKNKYFYKNNKKGISEKYKLNFCSPYGCSKGCGDQYVLDYAHVYNLKTVVFRQSCVYGPRQFGVEGQGWLAWITNSVIFSKEINLYGNGKQVRDILYIDDLISAFDLAFKNINKTKGRAYTIGGGINFSLSILEFLDILESVSHKKVFFKIKPWRLADQKVYISDVSSSKKDFNWFPKISPKVGIKRMYKWILSNKGIINNAGVFNSN